MLRAPHFIWFYIKVIQVEFSYDDSSSTSVSRGSKIYWRVYIFDFFEFNSFF